MTLPPMALRMNISNRRRSFGLWIPLFIIVPLLLILVVVLLPLLLVMMVVAVLVLLGRGKGGQLLRLILLSLLVIPRFFALFWALRGFLVDVRNDSEHVHISFR